MRARSGRRWLLALGLALSVLALVQAHHRAQQGRSALLKWAPAFEALASGEPIYEVGVEGYPTPPITLIAMWPFHAAGPDVGPLLWAALKIALAWWIVTRALALAAGRARDFPPLAAAAVLLLALRPLLSDVLHGNLNLLVGASVAAAAWARARGRDVQSGLWIGVGAVAKATPALGLVYFAWKRSTRALVGALLGIGTAALLLPAAFIGWERNVELLSSWSRQMLAPYLAGREMSLLQTEHINQSLVGVLARLTTDSVAIAPRPPLFPAEVRVNWLALDPAAFRAVHLAACALVVAWLFACIERREGGRRSLDVLGEFSLLALAMLFLSERSWKHHYVLSSFPLAFLAWHVCAHAARRALPRAGQRRPRRGPVRDGRERIGVPGRARQRPRRGVRRLSRRRSGALRGLRALLAAGATLARDPRADAGRRNRARAGARCTDPRLSPRFALFRGAALASP